MTNQGRPVEGARISWDSWDTFPSLRYGETWEPGQPISCRSGFDGMRCQNQAVWLFLINRTRIYVGLYGQFLYYL